jgi:hypothetical protein
METDCTVAAPFPLDLAHCLERRFGLWPSQKRKKIARIQQSKQVFPLPPPALSHATLRLERAEHSLQLLSTAQDEAAENQVGQMPGTSATHSTFHMPYGKWDRQSEQPTTYKATG